MSDNTQSVREPLVDIYAPLCVAPVAVAAPNDTDCIVHNLQTGATYRLNDVGMRIWELLETGSTVADITVALRREYRLPDDIAFEQVEADVQAIVADLRHYGLLVVRTTQKA